MTKPARRRLSVDERREQLLALGARIFAEQPYDEVSTDDIAARAGISRGLLFHYFPSKHAFYVAVLRVAADRLLGEIVVEHGDTPEARLVAGVEAYFRFVDEHALPYTSLFRGGVGSDPVVHRLIEDTRLKILGAIESALAPHTRGAVARRRLRTALRGWIGFVEAMALDWLHHRDLDRAEVVALALRATVVIPGVAALPRR